MTFVHTIVDENLKPFLSVHNVSERRLAIRPAGDRVDDKFVGKLVLNYGETFDTKCTCTKLTFWNS